MVLPWRFITNWDMDFLKPFTKRLWRRNSCLEVFPLNARNCSQLVTKVRISNRPTKQISFATAR